MTELHPSVLAEDLRLHADAIRHPDLPLAGVLEQAAELLAELERLRARVPQLERWLIRAQDERAEAWERVAKLESIEARARTEHD